ncbi:MAG: hypothetical protein ACREJW_00090 [Candidatus Methylomirabilales bacterium]
MHSFILIDPIRKSITIRFASTPNDLWKEIDGRGCDFGTLGHHHAIIVYEFGLLEPDTEQGYFSLANRLFVGKAVIFRSDNEGETINITRQDIKRTVDVLHFYPSAAEVEKAIQSGAIQRPAKSINGEVIWEWKPTPHD